MKKFAILTVVLLMVTASSTLAQAGGCMVPGTNVSCLSAMYGINLGYNFATMTGDGTKDDNLKKSVLGGLIIGGFFEYPMASNLYILAAINFIQNGLKKTYHYDWPDPYVQGKIAAASDPTTKLKSSYIQMPVTLKYVFPTKGKLKPSVLIGPSLSFNLSAKEESSGWGLGGDGEFDIENIKKINFGGLVGAGVAYPFGDLMVGLDVRYYTSFSNAFDDVTQSEIDNLPNDKVIWTGDGLEGWKAKHAGFQIGTSVILPIGAAKPEGK